MKTAIILWALVFSPANEPVLVMPVGYADKGACEKHARKIDAMRIKNGFEPIKWNCEPVSWGG